MDTVSPDEPQAPAPAPRFDFGWVIGKSFQVFFRRLPMFLVLATIVFVPVVVYGAMCDYPGRDFHGTFGQFHQTMPFTIALSCASWLLQPILSGAVIYATVEELGGRRGGVGRSLAVGISRMLPTIVTGLIVAVFTVLGVVGVVIGSYVVMCTLFVAVPVTVIEKLGPVSSITRSVALTKGYRWWILLLLFVAGALFGVPGAIAEFTVVQHDGANRLIAESSWELYKWLHIAIAVLGGLLGAVMHATMYLQLRTVKDGVGVEDLAKVFD